MDFNGREEEFTIAGLFFLLQWLLEKVESSLNKIRINKESSNLLAAPFFKGLKWDIWLRVSKLNFFLSG